MTAGFDAKSEPRAYLSRRYRVSASHRLHTEAYTAEENRSIYGKCNNPHGHGHNYAVEVTVGGPVNAETGMVCDLGELDEFARVHLIERFDQANLNALEEFRRMVPTTENLTRMVHEIFHEFAGARVVRVKVEETGNNSFAMGEELGRG
jgi:6-pyruvoyltetrahydropterin/6-carboxytetrahydropterin synthase